MPKLSHSETSCPSPCIERKRGGRGGRGEGRARKREMLQFGDAINVEYGFKILLPGMHLKKAEQKKKSNS